MAKHFFVADTHLEPESKPDTWRTFLSFLDFVQQEQGNLYILGDLFDYWSNNKLVKEKYRPLLEKLGEIAKSGEVGLLAGNRDFLLKGDYLTRWGIKFWGENHRRQIGRQQVFMTHGDIFWSYDASYQRFKQLGWPALRLLDSFTPAIIANRVAENLRNKSKQVVPNKPPEARRMNENLLQEYFRQGIDLVICGHLHKPTIKDYPGNKQLVILPAWENKGGGYCLLSQGRLELVET